MKSTPYLILGEVHYLQKKYNGNPTPINKVYYKSFYDNKFIDGVVKTLKRKNFKVNVNERDEFYVMNIKR